jgi:hypothetical protein
VTSISKALAAAAGARVALAEATGAWKAAAAAAAVGIGLAVTWLASAAWPASGTVGVLAGMGVLLAAGNGYAKAYSP